MIRKRNLKFSFPAGTSRGVLLEKPSYYILSDDLEHIGEYSYIDGLSPDPFSDAASYMRSDHSIQELISISPAAAMAKECYQDWSLEASTTWMQDGQGIAINGLVWMGDYETMKRRVRQKLVENYRCIKIKIGAIDLSDELDILYKLRSEYPATDIQIRVDANGAFSGRSSEKQGLLRLLDTLAQLQIHSIEQPIPPGHIDDMAELCTISPVPIALDEELIAMRDDDPKCALSKIMPQYIVIKPSFLGGVAASERWIAAAESLGIGWWVTSALESNVGLYHIAKWVSTLTIPQGMYQGLGTGQLFTNNISSPMYIADGHLRYQSSDVWNLSEIHSSTSL